MKWIILVGLLALAPCLVAILKSNPRYLPTAAFALGLLPFLEGAFHLTIVPIAWPQWPGIVKGTEVSLTDVVAIALLFTGKPVRVPRAIKLAFGAYVFAFLLSTAIAETKTPCLFYGWQILWTAIACLAVARASVASPKVPVALLTGLIFGLASEAVVAISQFARGVPQAPGLFVHQNLLGMAAQFVVYPALAAFLGGYYPKRALVGVAAGLIVAFAGGSRATIMLMGVGMVLTVIFSCWHKMNSRKGGLAFAALIGLILMTPLLYSAIERRSADVREGSNEERRLMMQAASMMISDYPMGVGANRYVVVANLGGYSARANLPWNQSNRAAPVHNTYYLVTAEMGWLGLIALVAVLASAIVTSIRVFRRATPAFESEYVVGITTSFIMVAVHAYVEWVTMNTVIHALFAINLGVVIAAHAAAKRRSSAEASRRRVVSNHLPETSPA